MLVAGAWDGSCGRPFRLGASSPVGASLHSVFAPDRARRIKRCARRTSVKRKPCGKLRSPRQIAGSPDDRRRRMVLCSFPAAISRDAKVPMIKPPDRTKEEKDAEIEARHRQSARGDHLPRDPHRRLLAGQSLVGNEEAAGLRVLRPPQLRAHRERRNSAWPIASWPCASWPCVSRPSTSLRHDGQVWMTGRAWSGHDVEGSSSRGHPRG